MAVRVTDSDWKLPVGLHNSGNTTCFHPLLGSEFLWADLKSGIFCVQLIFWSWTSQQIQQRVRVKQWRCNGGCGGMMVTERPVPDPLLHADSGMTSPVGAPLSLFSGALKFCTQRLRGPPISTSEWTQHFWKSLTRLNGGAISCQSTQTGCFSELP